jgi:uncharacterized SAM-binding protein YcdF (DUF218 family)
MSGAQAKPRQWILITLLAVVAVICLFAANAGRMLVVDRPERSDVILVLAGETYDRPARALQMLNAGYGRQILLDVPTGGEIFGFTQLDLARQYVQGLPQRAVVQICPIEGLSTKDEAHDAEKCLDRMPGQRVLIVTSDFHTHRALSILRHEIPNRTFSITAAHDDVQFGTRWWTHRQWSKTCLDEWLRTIWWNAVDRWR